MRQQDALVHLGVLVDDRSFVEQADLLEDLSPKRAREEGVDVSLRLGVAEGGASESQRALQGRADGPLDGPPRAAAGRWKKPVPTGRERNARVYRE